MGVINYNTTSISDVFKEFGLGTHINYSSDTYEKWPLEKCAEHNLVNLSNVNTENNTFNYFDTKIICLQHAPTLTENDIIKASVLSGMAVLSFIGNLATIISVKLGKRSRSRARPSWTAIYSLIFQLSVADLLVTIFCMFGDAAWLFAVEWRAGNIACKVFKFSQMFALYLSTFVLVLIGVDRWLAVKYPMRSIATATRSGKLVIIAWVLSVLLSIPQAIVFNVKLGPFFEEYHQCVTYGFYDAKWQEQTYTSLTCLFMFILPLIILISTYVSTVRTIAKSEKVFKPEIRFHQEKYLTPDLNRRKLIDRAKMKSLRMSLVIVVTFIVWWIPYYVVMIIQMFMNPDPKQSENLRNGIFFFGMSNSLVNPVIYGAFHLWPKKKRTRNSEKESGGHQASLLRRGDHTSSVRQTTIRSSRSSTKYSNGNNVSLL